MNILGFLQIVLARLIFSLDEEKEEEVDGSSSSLL